MTATWRETVPDSDWQMYDTAGFGANQELGSCPALLVVDVTRGFVGDTPGSRMDAARGYRNACGASAWEALPVIAGVLAAARDAGAPVYFTRGRSPSTSADLGRWASKNSRATEDIARGEQLHRIVDEIAPRPGETVFEKEKPSAFFGTPLTAHLVQDGVDTLVVTGCTTSGCVRATVVDAFSLNYSVVVVEDGVFDRGRMSHDVNLFDMHAKYAQVAPATEVLTYLKGLDRPAAAVRPPARTAKKRWEPASGG